MRACYAAKWKCFISWAQRYHFLLHAVSVPIILDYLLELKNSGLMLSSSHVHLLALSAFLPHMDD